MTRPQPSIRRIAGYELDALLGRVFVTLADVLPVRVVRFDPSDGLGGMLTLICADRLLEGSTQIDAITFSHALKCGAISEA